MENLEITKLQPPKIIEKNVNRLLKITGFVTILHEPHNSRNIAFSRYYHVRRVVWVSLVMGINFRRHGTFVDLNKLELLAWGHDLNRWPFSHNSEKGFFDQGKDLKRYITDNNLTSTPFDFSEVKHVIDKKINKISTEAMILLMADIITGFIEDPIWITTALNLSPSIIPDKVMDILKFNLKDKDLTNRLYELNLDFYNSSSHEEFVKKFDKLFCKTTHEFLKKEFFFINNKLDSIHFSNYRSIIKEEFLVKIVFPYNNEKISRGKLIREKLIIPYLNKIKRTEINKKLTELDEEQFIEEVISLKIINQEDVPTFYPRINYISKYEPYLSFRDIYEPK
ncbi:hypothetical protein HQ39_09515 [Porphyromonas sp. COT-108 OH2963]|uniref:hypothetical protein n=1 Tax=Porphyromonas sp. COT-108 OH2963 TaxID=1515614 RepID=UPI00052BB655|nr:hypothetical protein [Porphyromonas sp. COT-108 OH2963]KGN93834.1 hypothetical protein HQ39_09515 [Porphyromonas sp. COT-108 OH2963]